MQPYRFAAFDKRDKVGNVGGFLRFGEAFPRLLDFLDGVVGSHYVPIRFFVGGRRQQFEFRFDCVHCLSLFSFVLSAGRVEIGLSGNSESVLLPRTSSKSASKNQCAPVSVESDGRIAGLQAISDGSGRFSPAVSARTCGRGDPQKMLTSGAFFLINVDSIFRRQKLRKFQQ